MRSCLPETNTRTSNMKVNALRFLHVFSFLLGVDAFSLCDMLTASIKIDGKINLKTHFNVLSCKMWASAAVCLCLCMCILSRLGSIHTHTKICILDGYAVPCRAFYVYEKGVKCPSQPYAETFIDSDNMVTISFYATYAVEVERHQLKLPTKNSVFFFVTSKKHSDSTRRYSHYFPVRCFCYVPNTELSCPNCQ